MSERFGTVRFVKGLRAGHYVYVTEDNYIMYKDGGNRYPIRCRCKRRKGKAGGSGCPARLTMLSGDRCVYHKTHNHPNEEAELAKMAKKDANRSSETTAALIRNDRQGPIVDVNLEAAENSRTKQLDSMKVFIEQFRNQSCCDFQFEFEGSSSIGAHMCVLSKGSPVFAAMFATDMTEAKQRRVRIVDIDLQVFHHFLVFLYEGEAPQEIDDNMSQRLFEVAHKYCVNGLKSQCCDILVQKIGMKNAIHLLQWSEFYAIPVLYEAIMKFVEKHSRQLILLPEWQEMGKTNPELCHKATVRALNTNVCCGLRY